MSGQVLERALAGRDSGILVRALGWPELDGLDTPPGPRRPRPCLPAAGELASHTPPPPADHQAAEEAHG